MLEINIPVKEQLEWKRYRFKTKSVDDYRPLIFNPKYPWWCSGYTMNTQFEADSAIIIAYIPAEEDLKKYWDDAFDIDSEESGPPEFSDRFQKPDYYEED
jgi:hypothetical protein